MPDDYAASLMACSMAKIQVMLLITGLLGAQQIIVACCENRPCL